MTIIDASAGFHNLKVDKDTHIQAHLHVNFTGTDSPDYHLVYDQQVTCSRGKLMKSLMACQTYLE